MSDRYFKRAVRKLRKRGRAMNPPIVLGSLKDVARTTSTGTNIGEAAVAWLERKAGR